MKAEDIKLYGVRVLIKPLKQIKYKVKQTIPQGEVGKIVDGKVDLDSIPEVQDVHEEEVEVLSDIQVAKVIAIGDDRNIPCKVGDTIYFNIKTTLAFELINDTYLVKYFDIIGVK